MSKPYIKLPKLNGQKVRKKYYITNAVRHPAKADIPMMIWILERFVKDGEIVLDPMAGIGTTLLEGMRLFPNSLFIGIELEHKFVKWTNACIKKTERIAREDWFMEIGKAVCVQGDAKELEKVLKEKVSKIILSPPFGSARFDKKHGLKDLSTKGMKGRKDWKDRIDNNPKSKNNIGNLKYGKADKIVSSPPWGGQVQHKTNYLGKQKGESGFEYSEDPENIGNLPHGKIDKIVTSPPYSESIKTKTDADKRLDRLEKAGYLKKKDWQRPRTIKTSGRNAMFSENLYSRHPENIGNLKHGNIDKIITSPPFGQAQSGGGIAKKGYTGDKHSPTDLVGKRAYMPENTGENKNNISNFPYVDKVKGKNYLEAMFLVYLQCYQVLKPEGLMILITKDFIRDKKRVQLGDDTIKLCQMAGFKHIHTYHRKIENPSFWRILYQQKHPEVEQIDCEDILCFRKENEN